MMFIVYLVIIFISIMNYFVILGLQLELKI